MSKALTISDQLRDALRAEKRSLYELAAEAKVPRQCLSRFVNGGRSLSLETLDAVAGVLGLKLIQTRRAKR